DREREPATGTYGRVGVPQIINPAADSGACPHPVPALAQIAHRLVSGFWLAGKHKRGGAAPLPQPLDQFERGRVERHFVDLTRFHTGGRLAPESGLVVELAPLRLHRLVRPAAGQHDERDAVARARPAIPVLCERLAQPRQFCRAEESLAAMLWVARDAPARVPEFRPAPRLRLAG